MEPSNEGDHVNAIISPSAVNVYKQVTARPRERFPMRLSDPGFIGLPFTEILRPELPG
jgi:hypothetical protein